MSPPVRLWIGKHRLSTRLFSSINLDKEDTSGLFILAQIDGTLAKIHVCFFHPNCLSSNCEKTIYFKATQAGMKQTKNILYCRDYGKAQYIIVILKKLLRIK